MVLLLTETAQAVSEVPMGWPEAFAYAAGALALAWIYTHL